MFAIITTATLFLSGIGVLVCVWGLVCNDRTYRERISLLPSPADPCFNEKIQAFLSVSYERHHYNLFFFRDPYQLYPSILTSESP